MHQPSTIHPEPAPATESTPAPEGTAPAAQEAPKTTYSMSGGFPRLLARLDVSLGFTSYQSGKLYLVGRNPKKGGLMVDERLFPKAMGLAAEGRTLALATLFQIQRFENVLEKGQFINHTQDACYVPRVTYTTGVLDAHEIGLMADGRIVFVNTAYNCLAVPSERHSFSTLWMPPFISGLVEEDRCHLNGLAMEKGRPRYVTAVSRSDTIDGWRDRRANGGIVVDVDTGEIVCTGLSMPHSPRLVNGQLWVLNSGTGELGEIDLAKGAFRPHTFCPGFVRGLAIHGRHAFVGLSKPRYKRFEGLALDDRLKATDSEPWCGVQVIDLDTGTCVEWFRIDGAVAEIFDVAVLPGITCPMSLGFASNEIKTLITYEGLKPRSAEATAGAAPEPAATARP
ncbi:TIGR03032 family protein [Taklimakanibacter deserti]|uniref:TIGR03032 family protein n=1 Tax=Taklimakanibacter deserti TaxID=2267839 RepID=UPI0034D520A2